MLRMEIEFNEEKIESDGFVKVDDMFRCIDEALSSIGLIKDSKGYIKVPDTKET